MKRFKRMIALMCAMVMMLAMSTVAFAEEATTGASITVKGLAENDVETVKIYKIATATHDGEWKFETWAEEHKSIASDATEYTFDWDDMYTAVTADGSDITATDTKTCDAGSSTVTFTGLNGAAYLVTATGSKTTYAVMGAKTYEYNDETGRYTLIPTTVYAKTSDVPTKKEADDNFVHNGQEVTFTITTVLPAAKTLENNQEVNNEFKVYDKPENLTGLTLKETKVGVTVAEDGTVSGGTDATGIELTGPDTDGVYTIDLTSLLEANEGKTVVLTLTATVDGDQGYTNSAWNNKIKKDTDGKPVIPDDGKVDGYTADITITKYDEDGVAGGKTLTGAKFQIKRDGSEDALTFTQKTDDDGNAIPGQYIYDEAGTVTDVEVDEDGAVNVSGLDEGTYKIYETEAPEGYSIKSEATPVSVGANDTQNVSLESAISDTKLSSLPFTGGMGTTLFTVFGVIIMAAAAGLFFANKKKSAK